MQRDKIVLSLGFFALGLGVMYAICRSEWLDSVQRESVDLQRTRPTEEDSPTPQADALESGESLSKVVKREPDIEQIFRHVGYREAYVFSFRGGFLGADLFPVDEGLERVSVGKYWPTAQGLDRSGRVIVLINENGFARLHWLFGEVSEFGFVTQKSPEVLVRRDRQDSGPPTKFGSEITGFNEQTGRLLPNAFDGIRAWGRGPFPPGLTRLVLEAKDSKPNVVSEQTVFSIFWIEKP